MKTYRFLAFQDIKYSRTGYLEIEVLNEKEAQEKLSQMNSDEIEDECFNWREVDDSNQADDIDVDKYSIHEA